MPNYDRNLICLYPDDQLTHDEYILKQCISGTVAELLRLTFREDDKHLSMAGYDPRESRVTNWNFAGLYSAYAASGENPNDELATVYPGIFDFTEYFSRSVDASKGDFYEMRIAASDPNQVLDVDRNLENLPQYLYAPDLAWKEHKYTPSELTEDERERYEALDQLDIDFASAPDDANVDRDADTRQADSILLLDHTDYNTDDQLVLVFGEQRSSVNTGGTTARGSLYDKPEALLKGIASNVEVVDLQPIPTANLDFEERRMTLFEFLKQRGISRVNFFIGMLFNTIRQPAEREDDRTDGRWSESDNQTRSMRDLCSRLGNVSVNHFVDEKLDLEVEIKDPTGETNETITFRLAHEYGNHYANALYNGYPDREFDEYDSFPPAGEFDLPTVMGETKADDLWLHFSIAERENKAFYYGSEDSAGKENNAIRMVDMILGNDGLTNELASFRTAIETGDRETIQAAFRDARSEFADAYLDEHRDLINAIYQGEPEAYAYDLATHVLEYDAIVAPLFLKSLPDYHDYDTDDEMPKRAFIRKSMEEYLYEPKSEYGGADRVAMFRTIREATEYVNGGATPASQDDKIDWSTALTASEVADKMGVDSAKPHYMDQNRRGLVHADDRGGPNRYAVPADVAWEVDDFLFDEDDLSGSSSHQDTL